MTEERYDDPPVSTTGPHGPGLSMGPLGEGPEPDKTPARPKTDAEGYPFECTECLEFREARATRRADACTNQESVAS